MRHQVKGDKVFIVHGHDNEAKNEVARLIEKFGLNAIILHERPGSGKTLTEKLGAYSNVACYAIILYAACGLGRDRNEPANEEKFRARQNVVFEHGLFAGALGCQNVRALIKGDGKRRELRLTQTSWPISAKRVYGQEVAVSEVALKPDATTNRPVMEAVYLMVSVAYVTRFFCACNVKDGGRGKRRRCAMLVRALGSRERRRDAS